MTLSRAADRYAKEKDPRLHDNLDTLKKLYDPSEYEYPSSLGKYSRWWWELMRMETDTVPGFGACGVRWFTRMLKAGGTPVAYSYLFSHPSQAASGTPGTGVRASRRARAALAGPPRHAGP